MLTGTELLGVHAGVEAGLAGLARERFARRPGTPRQCRGPVFTPGLRPAHLVEAHVVLSCW